MRPLTEIDTEIAKLEAQIDQLASREKAIETELGAVFGTPSAAALETELLTLPTKRRAANLALERLRAERRESAYALLLENWRTAYNRELDAVEAERKAAQKVEKLRTQLASAENAHRAARSVVLREQAHVRGFREEAKREYGVRDGDLSRLESEIRTSVARRR